MSMTAQERTMAILSQIDEAARDVDHYEYGLPIYMDNPPEAMLVPIREVLEENARLRESVTWWQGVAEAKQEERDAALKEVGDLRAAFAKMGECPTAWAGMCAIEEDHARLRAGLEMLAQIRHVSGNAQPAFRSQLRTIDAILAGADVRDVAVVEAIAAGTWTKPEDGR